MTQAVWLACINCGHIAQEHCTPGVDAVYAPCSATGVCNCAGYLKSLKKGDRIVHTTVRSNTPSEQQVAPHGRGVVKTLTAPEWVAGEDDHPVVMWDDGMQNMVSRYLLMSEP